MNPCETFRQNFDACLDGNLPPARRTALHAHLAGCDACRDAYRQAERIEAAIAAEAASWVASDDLRSRIRSSAARIGDRGSARRRVLPWMAAAVLLLAIGLAGPGLFQPLPKTPTDTVATALVNEFHTFVVSHRALDYSDSESADVRRWFGDKVDFRVPLPVQSAELPLRGGRLCNMFDQRIASFMYRVDGAWVSLYIMHKPRDATAVESGLERVLNGYGFIDWEHQGLYYSLVGDLPVDQLRRIARQLRDRHSLTRASGLRVL